MIFNVQPIEVKNSGGVTVVTNAGCSGKYIGVMDLDIKDHKVIGYNYKMLPIITNLIPSTHKITTTIKGLFSGTRFFSQNCIESFTHTIWVVAHRTAACLRVVGIDAIFGGHTHDGMPKPIEVKNSGGVTVVTNAGCSGKYIGVMDLDIKDHKVISELTNT
jgi:2',3'-cyclic-nucleotide 2'-phosphodiesterase (5'-nucleotidase family)